MPSRWERRVSMPHRMRPLHATLVTVVVSRPVPQPCGMDTSFCAHAEVFYTHATRCSTRENRGQTTAKTGARPEWH